jgi:hypothetical protein
MSNDLVIIETDPAVVFEKNSADTRLKDALLVVEKAKGGVCPYCNPPTRGKRKFQPVKLADCKRLWDHGQQLTACLDLVSEARHRGIMSANDRLQEKLRLDNE